MELMIMGLQIILFFFLTIGVFCIVRKPVQKTPGIVLKKTHGQAEKERRKKCITGERAK